MVRGPELGGQRANGAQEAPVRTLGPSSPRGCSLDELRRHRRVMKQRDQALEGRREEQDEMRVGCGSHWHESESPGSQMNHWGKRAEPRRPGGDLGASPVFRPWERPRETRADAGERNRAVAGPEGQV